MCPFAVLDFPQHAPPVNVTGPFSTSTLLYFIYFTSLHFFTSLRFASLHFTSLHFTSLYFTSPHLTSPHLTSPHFTSPHLTSLHFNSPHLTSPHLTSVLVFTYTCTYGVMNQRTLSQLFFRRNRPKCHNTETCKQFLVLSVSI